jgi:5-methylcytosine-specific restriction endonuclease McrA
VKPSSVSLERKYVFPDPTHEKTEEWGERLWKLLRLHLELEVIPALRDPQQYEFMTDRLVNFVLARLVVRGVQIYKANRQLPSEVWHRLWSESVSDVLNVSDDVRDDITWHLSKICPRVLSDGAKLSGNQKKRITRFAHANSHRCYICGYHLEYDKRGEVECDNDVIDVLDEASSDVLPSRRSFEIDHMFPQKRGGGRSAENLAACCEECNKYKDVLLSFADFPLENAITGSIGASVRKTFGGRNKFALLWRQSGSCAICETKFHDASDERLYLIRRNPSDSYHSLNVDVACGACIDEQSLEGIQIRE